MAYLSFRKPAPLSKSHQMLLARPGVVLLAQPQLVSIGVARQLEHMPHCSEGDGTNCDSCITVGAPVAQKVCQVSI